MRARPPSPISKLILPVILLAYLAIGTLYAVRTPAWQIPDEPAHYNYVRHLVEQRSLPVLQAGDYPFAYLEQLKAERFPPELSVETIRYEAWQPPLYYLLAAPVFALTNGSLVAIRLFTLLLGSLVIVLTYALGRTLFPAAPPLALLAAGFVAFLPQHIAMLAAANNDALAEVIIALGVLLAVRVTLGWPVLSPESPPSPASPSHALTRSHAPMRVWLAAGGVLGLAFLTKLSAYPLAAVLGVALLLVARRERWTVRQFSAAAAQLYLPALVIGGLWWTRNLAVYGGLDFLAFARHDAVVQGQPRTSEILALWGARTYVVNFFQTTFQSFWGQFGWMGVVMDRRIYLALFAYSVVLLVGWGGALIQSRRAGGDGARRDALTLLAVHCLLTLAVYLYYNLSFVQFQGRYLYPALPVLAQAAALALRQWGRWLSNPLPAQLRPAAEWVVAGAPIVLMALLALFALYRFIIPQLAV